jgi:hypothetical protein
VDTHSDSQVSEAIKYNLKSRTRGTSLFSGGIGEVRGFLDEKYFKMAQRGIKLFLSLAQKKVNFKVKSGRQLSLIGDLRENSSRDVSI